jgi:uncharacterized membrane protein YoaK (UPF0700 family)
MDILALVYSIIGISIFLLIVKKSKNIASEWKRHLIAIIGLLVGIMISGSLSVFIGEAETAAKTGEYFVYLGITTLIISAIFFKENKGKPKQDIE